MALLVLTLFLLSSASFSSATWCICKEGVDEKALQKTLDYACGAGAECRPTHQNGPCFNPDTVRAHCSYAVNSYFQKNRQAPAACNFSGIAAVVNSDPSTSGCAYPATVSAATTMPSGSPLTNTGVVGGTNGLSPAGINPDGSNGEVQMRISITFMILTLSAYLFL